MARDGGSTPAPGWCDPALRKHQSSASCHELAYSTRNVRMRIFGSRFRPPPCRCATLPLLISGGEPEKRPISRRPFRPRVFVASIPRVSSGTARNPGLSSCGLSGRWSLVSGVVESVPKKRWVRGQVFPAHACLLPVKRVVAWMPKKRWIAGKPFQGTPAAQRAAGTQPREGRASSSLPGSELKMSEEGKGQAGGQPLPVVAVGSIPHIYRRASFTHRATP